MECTRADTNMQDTVRLCFFLDSERESTTRQIWISRENSDPKRDGHGKRVRIAFGAAVCGDMPCAALPRLSVKKCGDRETYRRKGGMLEISGK